MAFEDRVPFKALKWSPRLSPDLVLPMLPTKRGETGNDYSQFTWHLKNFVFETTVEVSPLL